MEKIQIGFVGMFFYWTVLGAFNSRFVRLFGKFNYLLLRHTNLQAIRSPSLSKLGRPLGCTRVTGDSYAACATSRTARQQAAEGTIISTWATRSATSATKSCRTRMHSEGTWPNTWALFGATSAIGHLHQKECFGHITRPQIAEKNRFVRYLKHFTSLWSDWSK